MLCNYESCLLCACVTSELGGAGLDAQNAKASMDGGVTSPCDPCSRAHGIRQPETKAKREVLRVSVQRRTSLLALQCVDFKCLCTLAQAREIRTAPACLLRTGAVAELPRRLRPRGLELFCNLDIERPAPPSPLVSLPSQQLCCCKSIAEKRSVHAAAHLNSREQQQHKNP